MRRTTAQGWRGAADRRSPPEPASESDEAATRFDYENAFDPPGGFVGAAATRVVNAAAGQREARKSMQRLRGLFEDPTTR